MKLIVNFRQRNTAYNPEDIESPQFNINQQFEVEAEDLQMELDEAGVFSLYGDMDGEEFEYDIVDLYMIQCRLADGEERIFAASNSLLKNVEITEKKAQNSVRYAFIIKDEVDIDTTVVVPIDGVFIDVKDFPEELLEEED